MQWLRQQAHVHSQIYTCDMHTHACMHVHTRGSNYWSHRSLTWGMLWAWIQALWLCLRSSASRLRLHRSAIAGREGEGWGEREREERASNLECCIRCVFCILAKHLALQNYTTTRTILDRTLVHTSPRQQYNELTPWLTKKEALAAVIVPWGLTNAGFSFAICSGVDTRMPLSALTAVPFPVLVPYND